MAIEQVGAATSSPGNSSLTHAATKPTGVAIGHVLVGFVHFDDASAPTITPPGTTGDWTLAADQRGGWAAGGTLRGVQVWLRKAGSSEDSSYTWTFNVATTAKVILTAWSGVDQTTQQDVAAATATGGTGSTAVATASMPDRITVTAGAMMLASVVNAGGSSTPTATITGMTLLASGQAGGPPFVNGATLKELRGAAGATGARTVTAGSGATKGVDAVMVILRPASSSQIASPIGQASSTQSALALTKRKQKAIGVAVDLQTSFPVTKRKRKNLPLVAETLTAQALTKRKQKALSPYFTEAETAQPLIRRKQRPISSGGASTSDLAFPLVRRKRAPVGLASTDETILSVSERKQRALGLGSTAETSQALIRRKNRSIILSSEFETSLELVERTLRAIGVATEQDFAYGFATVPRIALSIGLAVTNDTAFSLVERKLKPITLVLEGDSVFGLTRRKRRGLGLASTVDGGLSTTRRKSSEIAGTLSSEVALAMVTRRLAALGIAVEDDTAIILLSQIIGSLAPAIEVDSAGRALGEVLTAEINFALESDSALAIFAAYTEGEVDMKLLATVQNHLHLLANTKTDLEMHAS